MFKLNIQNIIYWSAIGILLIMLGLEKCKKDPSPCPEIVASKVDTVRDSIPYYIPKAYAVISYESDPANKTIQESANHASGDIEILPESSNGSAKDYIPSIVDSGEVLKPHTYRDTLWFVKGKDSFGLAIVRDSVRGTILKRSFSFEIKKITNNLETKPRNIYYVGADAIGNKDFPVKYIGLDVGLKFKNDLLITAGFGSMDSRSYYRAGFLYPIKRKKR